MGGRTDQSSIRKIGNWDYSLDFSNMNLYIISLGYCHNYLQVLCKAAIIFLMFKVLCFLTIL